MAYQTCVWPCYTKQVCVEVGPDLLWLCAEVPSGGGGGCGSGC